MTNFEIVKRDAQQLPAQDKSPLPDRMVLSDAAQSGAEALTAFTGDDQQTGPVRATVTAQDATVWTAIDASLSVPTVRVYCADPSSPYAHAALNTSIQHHGNELTITVPRIATPSRTIRYGNTYISGSGNAYSFTSTGDMHINSCGVTITSSTGGTVINGHRGVEIELLLPAGSGLRSTTSSGSVHGYGHLAGARIDAASGTVRLESVGRAEIEAASGSVRIGTVTEWISVNAASGSVKVARHSGQQARVRAASGSVTLTIAAEASGTVDVHSASGSVTLHGSHRRDMTINATASSGTVRRP